MIIARVTGHIVASAKTPYYRDYKILKVAPESWDGSPAIDAAPIIALDLVDAGIGERVLVCQEGRWARETLGHIDAPVRSMIVAIVDQISATHGQPPSRLG
jgi:ethanolamine utilization protein EutN